jgi:hypothetical protein
MKFIPGLNSPLDTTAGGAATYKEIIPALYANYVYESKKLEAEIGLRVEYVNINYVVGSNASHLQNRRLQLHTTVSECSLGLQNK